MIRQPDVPVILASASPRRKDILEKLGLIFTVRPAHTDETLLYNEDPLDYACRISEEKGQAIAQKHPDAIVIASDTVVVYGNHILGKPADRDDARRMLRMLSGQTHRVITAFTLILKDKNITLTDHETTDVTFRNLRDEEILDYISTGSPLDKAGAYGIQDLQANFVESISGCFYNVTGFPVARFKKTWGALFT